MHTRYCPPGMVCGLTTQTDELGSTLFATSRTTVASPAMVESAAQGLEKCTSTNWSVAVRPFPKMATVRSVSPVGKAVGAKMLVVAPTV